MSSIEPELMNSQDSLGYYYRKFIAANYKIKILQLALELMADAAYNDSWHEFIPKEYISLAREQLRKKKKRKKECKKSLLKK